MITTFDDVVGCIQDSFDDFLESLDQEDILIGGDYEKVYEVNCTRLILDSLERWVDGNLLPLPIELTVELIERTTNNVGIWLCAHPDSWLHIKFKSRPLVKLPLEVFNDEEVDVDKAWKELDRLCRGI